MSKKIIRKKILIDRKLNYKTAHINYSLLKKIFKIKKIGKNKIIGGYYPINFEIDGEYDLEWSEIVVSHPTEEVPAPAVPNPPAAAFAPNYGPARAPPPSRPIVWERGLIYDIKKIGNAN